MPTNIDDYVHRIGRTGRVGNSGRATSFFDPEQDRTLAADLIKILEGSGQEVPEFLKEIGGGSSSYCSSKFGGIDVRGGVSIYFIISIVITCREIMVTDVMTIYILDQYL